MYLPYWKLWIRLLHYFISSRSSLKLISFVSFIEKGTLDWKSTKERQQKWCHRQIKQKTTFFIYGWGWNRFSCWSYCKEASKLVENSWSNYWAGNQKLCSSGVNFINSFAPCADLLHPAPDFWALHPTFTPVKSFSKVGLRRANAKRTPLISPTYIFSVFYRI